MTAELPDVTAAELALGLLDGENRLTAMRRVLAEPEYAKTVSWWREQFGLMAEVSAEIAPPTDMFERIIATLEQHSTAPRKAAAMPGRFRRWQITTAAACLVSAVCLAALSLHSEPPPVVRVQQVSVSPVLIAQLAAAGKPVALAAVYDPAHRLLKIARTSVFARKGRGEQLWVIAGKLPPRPIGMIDAAEATLKLNSSDSALIEQGATLAVSIEPLTGSPTGKPTGPIVATGLVSKI